MRGETFLDQGRLLYVDCYNANPASMLDALEIFLATAPAGKPRLFVLGCMEELGWESSRYHRELGRTLALGFEDRALVVGSEARSLVEGLLEAGARHDQVEAHESAAQMRESVAAWRGSVFVKGSRRYQLETVLGGIAAVAQGAAH